MTNVGGNGYREANSGRSSARTENAGQGSGTRRESIATYWWMRNGIEVEFLQYMHGMTRKEAIERVMKADAKYMEILTASSEPAKNEAEGSW